MYDRLVQLDNTIFFAINNGLHGSVGDLLIGNATYLGNGWLSYAILIIAVILFGRQHLKRNLLLLAALAIGEGLLLQLAKLLWDTPRPLLAFASALKAHSVVIHVMFDPLIQHSFPSGHTQTAFCCATFIVWLTQKSRLTKPWRIGIIVLSFVAALDVGISRMYVGAHFPVDVLGGMILGAAPVWIVATILDRRATPATSEATSIQS